MSHQRTVYVVDDDTETRRSLTIQLAAMGAEAWPFARGEEFLEIVDHLMPACILLGTDMESPSGIELLAALASRGSGWPIIAISGRADVGEAVQAMKLGALDFLEKPIKAPKLAAALIPAWSRLESSVAEQETRRVAELKLARLTPREVDIAVALFGGLSNKAVAHQLGISVRTVEMHRAHLMAKLGVKSLAEAAVMATQAGLERRSGEPASTACPTIVPAASRLFGQARNAGLSS